VFSDVVRTHVQVFVATCSVIKLTLDVSVILLYFLQRLNVVTVAKCHQHENMQCGPKLF
jgi:hypothetical protein